MPSLSHPTCTHHWLVASLLAAQASPYGPPTRTLAYAAQCRRCGVRRDFPTLDAWYDFNEPQLGSGDPLDDDPAEPTPEEASAWAEGVWSEGLGVCLRAS